MKQKVEAIIDTDRAGDDGAFGVGLRAAQYAEDFVCATMGPSGRNVLISPPGVGGMVTLSTKDGAAVVRVLQHEEGPVNMVLNIIKNAAQNTANSVGDGTTTCCLLVARILNFIARHRRARANVTQLQRGVDFAVDYVGTLLKDKARNCETLETLVRVATISANNDERVGRVIGETVYNIGSDGAVTFREAHGQNEVVAEIQDGYFWDKGIANHSLLALLGTRRINLDNPAILMYTGRVQDLRDVLPLLKTLMAKDQNRPMVLIASSFAEAAIQGITENMQRHGVQLIPVVAPGFGNEQVDQLEDIAALCGGRVLKHSLGESFLKASIADVGQCDSIEIGDARTVIRGGAESQARLMARINYLHEAIAEQQNVQTYDLDLLKGRLSRLSGSVGTILVGGRSGDDIQEKKFLVEDAIGAARAALRSGILPGSGVALLRVQDQLRGEIENRRASGQLTSDAASGALAVADALDQPIRRIAENCGLSGETLIESALQDSNFWFGTDMNSGFQGDLFELGVVDPLDVVTQSLKNAGAACGIIVRCGAMLVVEQDAPPSPMGY